MTATPAYGFRIGSGKGKGKGGLLKQAMRDGDLGQIKGILTQRFPELKFAEAETEDTEIARPTEVQAAPTAMAEAATADEGESTASLYNDYMAGLPAGIRGLVTTDYKGVRGSRLGRGNYTTASTVPGAQVSTPAPATAPAPSTGGGTTTTTTYNAPVVGGNWQQYYGDYYSGDVNYGTIGGATDAEAAAPAATSTPSAAPSTPSVSSNQQFAAQAIRQAKSAGGGAGVSAAAKSTGNTGSINRAEATALKESGLSSKQIEKRAEKQGVKLTNNARKELGLKKKK